MAALSTGDVILAKQAVGTWQGTDTFGMQPQMGLVMKAIWMGFATHQRSLQLEYLPFVGQTAFNNIVDNALKFYVFYVKKQNDATDSYQKVFDDASDDTTATDVRITLPTLIANEEAIAFYPKGLDMTAGVVVASHTTSSGSTDSVATADTADGFCLVGEA